MIIHDSDINYVYIRLTDKITPDDVGKLCNDIKCVIRNEMRPEFVSILDLRELSPKKIKEHIKEVRQVTIPVSIKRVSRILRLGGIETLAAFKIVYDEYYLSKHNPPIIAEYNSLTQLLTKNTDLNSKFLDLVFDDLVILDV